MLSLKKLAITKPKAILYIERIPLNEDNFINEINPNVFALRVEDYICIKNEKKYKDNLFIAKEDSFAFSFIEAFKTIKDSNWVSNIMNELEKEVGINKIENKINKVLKRYSYYTAGDKVENDI